MGVDEPNSKMKHNGELRLGLHSEDTLGVLGGHAELLASLAARLIGLEGQAAAVSQLGAEVLWLPLLVLVVLAEVLTLILVEDGEDAGNVLAHDVDLAKLGGISANLLGNAELGELLLELTQLLQELGLVLAAEITSAKPRRHRIAIRRE